MMSPRWQADDGVVTSMVAVLAVALIACAGLAYDGGAVITATAAARDVAGSAARTAAQQLDVEAIHSGRVELDPFAARQAADAVLAAAGMLGAVSVNGDTVTVTVFSTVDMRLLPGADRAVSATVSATAVSDVLGGTP